MKKIYFKGLPIKRIAELLDVTYMTAYNKCKDPTRFTGAELLELKKATGLEIEKVLERKEN